MPIPLRLALISVILIVLSQIPWRKIELPKAAQAQSAPEVIKKPKIDHYTPLTLPPGMYKVDRVETEAQTNSRFSLWLVHADTGSKLPFPLRASTLQQTLDREKVKLLYGALVEADQSGVVRYIPRE